MATIKYLYRRGSDVEIIGGIVFETNPNDIPACNPNNSCDIIQEFIEEAEYSYDEYLRVKRDCLREIGNVEDTIEAHASKIRESISYIKELKLKMDEAFNKYKSSWQQ
jgi:5,10-methylenetetrahydrofolate reductase